jgi:hypothetical protein
VLGGGPGNRFFKIPLFERLPQSVTSLAIDATIVDLEQMRDLLVLLPNLDNLSLSGTISVGPGTSLRGLGTVLRARFGGKLRLRGLNGADRDFVNMLLDVPTVLHFTEVHVHSGRAYHLSTVRLVEGCHSTLTKLSYGCLVAGKSYSSPDPSSFQH